MKMNLQIISKENVKPSSSTPPHLRRFRLSLLDQLIPAPYAPIVLFYSASRDKSHLDDAIPRRLEKLKASLSETLTRFYPLAGTIEDDLSIECNDEGAFYVETRVNCCLDDFLCRPDLLLINQFLPTEPNSKESTYVTNIQVNLFNCGGVAIGICISHRILDGAALSTFLKGWTAAARGSNEVVYPKFIASSLFPANDLWLRDSSLAMWRTLFRKGRCITRRFVFDEPALAALQAQTISSFVKSPTRVEVVSAFLWTCIVAASEELHGTCRPSLITHLVNLRKRMAPASSENSLGNLLWLAVAPCPAESRPGLKDLVGELRKAISRIDDNFVEKLKCQEGNFLMSESLKETGELGSKDGAYHLGFSSWCRLGFYDADFGWGVPVWVSSIGLAGSAFLNLVILADTRLGNGIEAWVTLDEKEMAILQRNPGLLKSASLDPSPLIIGNSSELQTWEQLSSTRRVWLT